MSTDLFNYHLPPERIAQHSVEPRDHSRLLVLDRQTGQREHKQFFEIVDEFKEGDVLVMNNTKVFRARLFAAAKNRQFEIFLLRAMASGDNASTWEVLLRDSKRLNVGDPLSFEGMSGSIVEKKEDGVVVVELDRSRDDVIAFADAHGEIPIPPYVNESLDDISKYQTVYARETGSVAAPTAGFHFTDALIEQLKQKGVEFAFVTLHVGLGTFRPMKSETLDKHEMHAEFVTVDVQTAETINRAKQEGRRVIAVGTTTVRTLEGIAATGRLRAFSGDVNLFITPGFAFKVIDALITNFHLPKSTLLVLVSAFAGRESILDTYKEAVDQEYRFYSFGDAMFIR